MEGRQGELPYHIEECKKNKENVMYYVEIDGCFLPMTEEEFSECIVKQYGKNIHFEEKHQDKSECNQDDEGSSYFSRIWNYMTNHLSVF